MPMCYDCGSTIPKHHTENCELAEADAVRDLPSVRGSHWWTEAAIRICGSVENAERAFEGMRRWIEERGINLPDGGDNDQR